tara:strand:+ start:1730 stop:1882 length:153 start_codon:yes stop_codon:yes gene_type:complete
MTENIINKITEIFDAQSKLLKQLTEQTVNNTEDIKKIKETLNELDSNKRK